MKNSLIFLTLLCSHLSAAVMLPLDNKLPPQLPMIGPPVANQNQQRKGGQFVWAPIQINGKQYLSLKKVKIFYFFNNSTVDEKTVILENRMITAEFTINSQKFRFNGIHFYLSEPVRLKDGVAHVSSLDVMTLIDPVLRPTFIRNARPTRTVILDAGHGGKDKGSAGKEAKHTLAVAQLTKQMLEKKGYTVILTRSEDIGVPLEARLKQINATGNAIVISVHFNSGKKEAAGFETYVMSAREPNPFNQASVALATAVHSRILLYLNNAKYGNDFKIEDRGIRHAKFRLLKDSKHPTILIEAGFLTNRQEAQKITSDAYQQRLATSIVRGIDTYNASLGRKKR